MLLNLLQNDAARYLIEEKNGSRERGGKSGNGPSKCL